jgi:hypothetical protein
MKPELFLNAGLAIGIGIFVQTATVVAEPASPVQDMAAPGLLEFELRGRDLFNRPLYGVDAPFVTYGGSLPAFAISGGWYGGKLGNLHLVIAPPAARFAAHEAEQVKATYDGLALRYEIRDRRIEEGVIHLEVLSYRRTKGCLIHLAAGKLPAGISLAWVYGGASGEYDFKYPGNYGSKPPILPLRDEHRRDNSLTPTTDGVVLRWPVRKGNDRSAIPKVACAPVSRLEVAPSAPIEFVDDMLAENSTSSGLRRPHESVFPQRGRGTLRHRTVRSDRELAAVEAQCLSDQILFGIMAMTLYLEK